MKVLIISTSLSGNKTRRSSEQFLARFKEYSQDRDDIQIDYIKLSDKDMVFADGRHYLDNQGDTLEVLEAIMASDLIIFATPIYQASIASPLKNLFDLLPTQALNRKVVGLIITAGSARHYLVGETQIIPILHYMYASVVPKYVYITDFDFDADGSVSDDIEFRFQTLIEDSVLMTDNYLDMWDKQDQQYGF